MKDVTKKYKLRTIFRAYNNRMKVLVPVLINILCNTILVFGLKNCPTITLKNGSVKYRSRGRIVRFRCNRGFTLDGENYGACIRGEWDVDIPTCVFRSRCSPITQIHNGHVIANKQWTSLRFICNNGYHLIGQSQLQCRNSKWDGESPQCRATVQLSCDFEKNGNCGWDNSTKSGYFWLRRQYATPSHFLNTGPGHDHTLHPKNNGHYLYIETSGLYAKNLKTTIARLYSPLFPPVDNNGTCFTFWYHMFGSTIGELIVYIDGHKVFHKAGNQGNRWIKGIVRNLPSDTFFQISIEGVPGNGWTGDIAVDDLNITTSDECVKPEIEDTTCDGRCYEDELQNSTLCQCNQKCIAKSVCCSDFFDVCNADKTTSSELKFTSILSENGTTSVTRSFSISTTVEDLTTESSTLEDFSSGYEITESKDQTVSSNHEDIITDNFFLTVDLTDQPETSTDLYSLTFTTENVNFLSTENEAFENQTDSSVTEDLLQNETLLTDSFYYITKTDYFREDVRSSSQTTSEIFSTDITYNTSDLELETSTMNTSETPLESAGLEIEKYTVKNSTLLLESSSISDFGSTINEVSKLSTAKLKPTLAPEKNVSLSINSVKTLAPHTHLPINATVSSTTVHNMLPFINDSFEQTNSTTVSTQVPTTYPSWTHVINHSQIVYKTTYTSRPTIKTLPVSVFIKLARTERTRWKSVYQPKGYYTYSAMKQEQTNNGMKKAGIILGIVLIFIIALSIGMYLYRRRNFLNNSDNVEEADVLFIPTDEILDFSLSRPNSNVHRIIDVNKV